MFMRAFATTILKGRAYAILISVVAIVFSLILPPVTGLLTHISGATIGLVTLRKGFAEGLIVVVGTGLIIALLGQFASQNPVLMGVSIIAVIVVGIPVLLAAFMLRVSRSLGVALAVAGLLALSGLLLAYAMVGDVALWWQNTLLDLLEAQGANITEADKTQVVGVMSAAISGVIGSMLVYNTMINLFIARWLQALLYNPGGFRKEFNELQLGKRVTSISLLILGISIVLSGGMTGFALNVLIILVAVYAIQGLALAHTVVSISGAGSGWLIVLYVLLVFLFVPSMMVLFLAGLIDSWLDFRTRLRDKKQRSRLDQ